MVDTTVVAHEMTNDKCQMTKKLGQNDKWQKQIIALICHWDFNDLFVIGNWDLLITSFSSLGSRLTVGLQPLELRIGVQIPAPQQIICWSV